MLSEKVLWIGLVHFRPLPACDWLDGDAGLYSNLITWAGNPLEFSQKAELLADEYALFVVEIEEEEPLAVWKEKWTITEELDDLADRAMQNPSAILLSTLHRYKFDEA